MSMHTRKLLLVSLMAVVLSALSALSCQKEPETEYLTATVTKTTSVIVTTTAFQTVTVTTTAPCPTKTVNTPTTSTPPVTTATTPPTTTTHPTTTNYDPYMHYEGFVLDGYPEDVWPLYESEAVDRCALYIRFPARSFMDKFDNNYNLIYISEAPKEDIVDFYTSLLTTPGEPGDYYDVLGEVNGYQVDVLVDEGPYYNEVYISVALPNTPPAVENPFYDEWPVDHNPYLADWSEEKFPLYELENLWMEYCNVNSNNDGEMWYEKEFTHSGTYQEAIEFYRELFSDAEDFEENIEDYEWGDVDPVQFSGSKYGYEFRITVGAFGDPKVISLVIWEPL